MKNILIDFTRLAEKCGFGEIAQAEPQYVDLPTDLIIIPEFERTKVASFNDVTANTNYIQGIGVNDDLARDIRAAAPNTVLAQSYAIGKDTVIVKVVSKKEADRAAFEANLEAMPPEAKVFKK